MKALVTDNSLKKQIINVYHKILLTDNLGNVVDDVIMYLLFFWFLKTLFSYTVGTRMCNGQLLPLEDPGVKSRIVVRSPSVSKKVTKLGGFSE